MTMERLSASPIEKSTPPCISMAMEPLPFGQSHWDYLPVEIQEHILDLAARSLHRNRISPVFLAIHNHVYWLGSRLCKKLFSQRCPKCYKQFLPELCMPRHRAICEGVNIQKEREKLWKAADRGDTTFEEVYEDTYGYPYYGPSVSGDPEDEDTYEPILWRLSNM